MGQSLPAKDVTVLINGKIYQSQAEDGDGGVASSFAGSMVVSDGIIQHIGSDSDAVVAAARESGATVKDLDGQVVLPGFIDGHLHILMLGQGLNKVGLEECKSLDDIRQVIKTYAVAHPDADRIWCRGWMHSMTPDIVEASLLDDIDPRPIFIDSKDLHSTWCSTAGLAEVCKLMEISKDTPDPVGGVIQRGPGGVPNGLFVESGTFQYIWPFAARVASMKEKKGAIRSAIKAFQAAGYTGMIDMAMDDTIWDPLLELRNEEGLGGMRIAAYWLMKPSESMDQVLAQVHRAVAMAKEFNSETTPDCRVVGIKVICDGIIDGCTASLTEPYSTGTNSADPIWAEEMLHPVVAKAHAAGLQVALHAIGDKTIRMAIDVLEKNTDRSLRPRIEHLELASENDAQRLGKLGITASIQPVHADPAILRAWPKLLGEERCKRAFAYREFAEAGAPLALGSDAPTAPHLPLPNLFVATTRRSYREPELETVVNPHSALTVCQAVAGATHGSAYSCFADKWTGTLKPGMKADFVVCQVEMVPAKLINGVVKETWFEGKQVFKA